MKHLLTFDWKKYIKINPYRFSVEVNISEGSKNLLKEIFQSLDDYEKFTNTIVLPEKNFYICSNSYANRDEIYINDGLRVKQLPLGRYKLALIIDDEKFHSEVDYGIYYANDIHNKSIEELKLCNLLKDTQKPILEDVVKEIFDQILPSDVELKDIQLSDQPDASYIPFDQIRQSLESGRTLLFNLEHEVKNSSDKLSAWLTPSDITKDAYQGINKIIELDSKHIFITNYDNGPHLCNIVKDSINCIGIDNTPMFFILNLNSELNIENGLHSILQELEASYLEKIDWTNAISKYFNNEQEEVIAKQIGEYYLL